MRIALFGKAVSPDDADALRMALDRVLEIDPAMRLARERRVRHHSFDNF